MTEDDITSMREQIDAEKAAGIIMDPMQIAQQGQAELAADTAGAKIDNAPTSPAISNASPEASDDTNNKPIKGDLSLKESYNPAIRMMKRVV